MIRFTIPGRSVPYVRTTQRQKFIDPSYRRYHEFKQYVGWLGKLATKEKIDGPVAVELRFYLTGKIMGKRGGDIDNLIKGVLDSLNGICFDDDRQVVKVSAEKIPVEDRNAQKTEVIIRPMVMEIAEVKSLPIKAGPSIQLSPKLATS